MLYLAILLLALMQSVWAWLIVCEIPPGLGWTVLLSLACAALGLAFKVESL